MPILYERLTWGLLAAIMLVIGIAYERQQGAQACIQRDTKAAVKQQVKTAEAEGKAGEVVREEAKDYADTIAKPVTDAPHVWVRPHAQPPHPGEVLCPAAAAAGTDAAAEVRAEPARDIGTPVVTVGRDADAQVTALQDYVRRVCLAGPR